MQTALQTVFPGECLACDARLERAFGLCAECWSDTPFITGAACDMCGTPLPGAADPREGRLRCDECLSVARPWQQAAAVFAYAGVARQMVLGLKHGDRSDIARAAGPWMAQAGRRFLTGDPVIVPVPLHWLRLARRRYNQAALLAQSLGRAAGHQVAVRALVRRRRTPVLDGLTRAHRFEALAEAIEPHPRHAAGLRGPQGGAGGRRDDHRRDACRRRRGHPRGRSGAYLRDRTGAGRHGPVTEGSGTQPEGSVMADVEIYTSPLCGFCHAAKRLLTQKGVAFTEIDVGGNRESRQQMLARAAGRHTVPQIFVGDTHVGGYDDLAALDREGKLDPLLAA